MRILISAGEASGDLYASRVVEALRARHPDAVFFGCAGPRMQAVGVRAIIDMRSISEVGLVEIIRHIPRIWAQFRKLVRAIPAERPDLAILTDAPDLTCASPRNFACPWFTSSPRKPGLAAKAVFGPCEPRSAVFSVSSPSSKAFSSATASRPPISVIPSGL